MPGARFYGLFDQAGVFSPLSGEQAATMRALPGVTPKLYPGADPAPGLVWNVRGEGGYGGNLGFLHPAGVADAPLVTAAAYFGNAPAELQPGITKPPPYQDPTAAAR